jgi:hypothetical protein
MVFFLEFALDICIVKQNIVRSIEAKHYRTVEHFMLSVDTDSTL